jgi:subtilisin family serine protease
MVMLLWPAGAARAAEPPRDDTVLVRLRGDLSDGVARQWLREAGLEPVRRIPRIAVWVARPAGTERADLRALQARDEVLFAEENGLVTALDTIPNDPRYPEQWALPKIEAPAAWALARGMAAPIAIIDTGLDLDHGDLQAKLWVNPGEIPGNGLDDDGNGYVDDVHGYDIRNDDATPQDDNGHGSHVGSIAAASSNDAFGVAGVAWDTPLMAVKVLHSNRDGTWADVAEGVIYAADNGARIINLSLGGTSPNATLELAVTYALSKGCLLVAAAGNNSGAVLYPARLPGVVAVAATTSTDQVWSGSSRGPEVDLAAPGVGVLGCDSAGSWYLLTGTSMAAPHVAGVAALIWGLRPELPRPEPLTIMRATADDIGAPGEDDNSGAGRLNARAAVETTLRWRNYALPVVAPAR